MKKYYIDNYNDFGNTYDLCWSETDPGEPWERITRKQAIELCCRERYRSKYDSAFSGFAPTVILPFDYDRTLNYHDYLTTRDGYIYE